MGIVWGKQGIIMGWINFLGQGKYWDIHVRITSYFGRGPRVGDKMKLLGHRAQKRCIQKNDFKIHLDLGRMIACDKHHGACALSVYRKFLFQGDTAAP